jgi:cation:H+ antiporter
MLVEFLIVAVGFIIVVLLSNVVIKNSIQIATHYGLSGTFIGLTILSIGTSIPEIVTHIIGSIQIVKNPALMGTMSNLLIGANIGSDIFQQNFVLAIVGLFGAVVVIRKNLNSQVGALIAAAILVWLFALSGFISRVEGGLLVLAYVAYLIYLKKNKLGEDIEASNHLSKKNIVLAISLILFSFVIIGFATHEVLNASTILVASLPISASFFGVILLGIASALPELTTSLIALFKGKKDISAGILIGSNVTNPLFGIGIGALISGYSVANVVTFFDLPVKIATAFMIYYFLWRNKELNKWESVVLIILYLAFIYFRQVYFPVDF